MTQTLPTTRAPSQRHLGASVNGWHVAATFAGLAASFWALRFEAMPTLRSLAGDQTYFDSQPLLLGQRRMGYSLAEAQQHLKALGNAACSYYADTYIALYDLVCPLMLLAFGVLLILYATQTAGPHALKVTPGVQRLMLAVPVLLFVFNIGENLLLSTMLDMYPNVSGKVVETASLLTQLKWMAAFFDGLLMLGLIVHTVHRHIEAVPLKAKA